MKIKIAYNPQCFLIVFSWYHLIEVIEVFGNSFERGVHIYLGVFVLTIYKKVGKQ